MHGDGVDVLADVRLGELFEAFRAEALRFVAVRAASEEYSRRLREAWFRDPVWAEPTAERRALERADHRAALAEAEQTSGAGSEGSLSEARPAPDALPAEVG